MNKVVLSLISSLIVSVFFLSFSAISAEPRLEPTEQERARTVYIFHQPIVMLQAKFGFTTPEERVLRIRDTLRNFTQEDVREPLKIIPVTRYNQQGRLFVMNAKPVMLLTESDLDEGDDLTLDQAAQRVLARMKRSVPCFATNMTLSGLRFPLRRPRPVSWHG
ncbi:MscS mechanosensitive ion channel [Enterobacter asburiae]|uniref:MscS mechanosensitive ion channel n=1 Tax=Enterobacter asburiae TaxID=61645 RepID=A0A376FAL9_ENTAS|nr:MscS mechanosensitive ion channel [Enterobacter asburiae]